jgi:RNA polymerase sigma-70 factor (ECF subfamily)
MLVNTTRRGGRHPQVIYPSEKEESGTELSSDASPEYETFRELLNSDVAAAMSELPIRYRAVVLLADIEGLSYKEIADIVGCPVGTVVSRLCRGRRLLGKRLQR